MNQSNFIDEVDLGRGPLHEDSLKILDVNSQAEYD